MSAISRFCWVVLFGAAFGWVEAAVVVDLRALFYPDGFAMPLRPITQPLLAVELIREAATLAMLAAVGVLAGRTRWQRFAAFLAAFGVWDLVYYLALTLILGWPTSLAEWDVLFLLPWPWLGPVYAPAGVAVLMIGFGGLVFRRETRRPGRADRWAWLLGAVGALLLLWSWMYDLEAALRGAAPRPYPLAAYGAGLVLLTACGVRFLRLGR